MAAEGAALTAGGLRERVAAVVPEYMVPAVFVAVAGLPVTLHGKLDEAGLPAPSPENLLPGQSVPAQGEAVSFPSPRTSPDQAGSATDAGGADEAGASVGARVAEMVGQLLAVSSVDPDDNIFLVGGHSMLAMQLVARIKQTFGVKLTLRQVFEAPTVTGLTATVLERTGGTAATPSPTPAEGPTATAGVHR